jgi:hypothetical protein
MKLNRYINICWLPLTVLLSGALLTTGCTEEEATTADEGGEPSYISLSITISGGTETRATSEDSGDYTYGTEDEYKVNDVYLYFFDNGSFMQRVDVSGFSISSEMDSPISSTSVETYTSDSPTMVEGLTAGKEYTIVAMVNNPLDENPSALSSLFDSQLGEMTSSLKTMSAGSMPMSSRDKSTGSISVSATFNAENTSAENPLRITIPVERSYGKIAIKAKKVSGQTSPNVYPIYNSSDELIATNTLTGYKLINLPINSYAFRHVANYSTPGTIDNSTASYGVMNSTAPYVYGPDYAQYVESNVSSTSSFLFDEDSYTDYPTDTADYDLAAYLYENAMDSTVQMKGFCTGVIFECIAQPVSVDTLTTSGDVETVDFSVIAEKYGSSSDSLYFIGGRFYLSIEAIQTRYETEGVFSDLTESNLSEYNVEKYSLTSDGVICYYPYWIRHLDNEDDSTLGKMEYAIVRNNAYQLCVNSISGMGNDDDTYDPDEPVEDGKNYITVSMTVGPWNVSKETATIGSGD